LIDIRINTFAARVREIEGKTALLIYETTLIVGTMAKIMNEKCEGTGDMLLDWIKSKEFADMVESMAKGDQALRRETAGGIGWELMQKFAKERKKHAAD
jgi:hypothetical protein